MTLIGLIIGSWGALCWLRNGVRGWGKVGHSLLATLDVLYSISSMLEIS